jgi:hypothetical protein
MFLFGSPSVPLQCEQIILGYAIAKAVSIPQSILGFRKTSLRKGNNFCQ